MRAVCNKCSYISKGGFIVHYHLLQSTQNFCVNVSPNTGGYYFGISEVGSSGFNQVKILQSYNVFQVFSTQNWIDQSNAVFQSISSVLSPIVGGVTNVNKINTPNSKGEVSSTAGADTFAASYNTATQVVGNTIKSIDIVRDVMLGGDTQISPNYEGSIVGNSAICICTAEPLYVSNINEIKEHLIRYGYITYLEPYDILTNHKRRYFNYIRCNTVRVTISQPQNVIDSIKEMLLNGVWLFSYVSNESIFKLDGVVNMPANLGIEV